MLRNWNQRGKDPPDILGFNCPKDELGLDIAELRLPVRRENHGGSRIVCDIENEG